MPWASLWDLSSGRDFLSRAATDGTPGESRQEALYAIVDGRDRLMGGAGLHRRLGPGALEIGYWVDVRFTRRGVATAASALLTEFAFTVAGVGRVEIHHDAANEASAGVPAKLGFTHFATFEDDPEAPAEVGIEMQWRMWRRDFPASGAAALLEEMRSARRS